MVSISMLCLRRRRPTPEALSDLLIEPSTPSSLGSSSDGEGGCARVASPLELAAFAPRADHGPRAADAMLESGSPKKAPLAAVRQWLARACCLCCSLARGGRA